MLNLISTLLDGVSERNLINQNTWRCTMEKHSPEKRAVVSELFKFLLARFIDIFFAAPFFVQFVLSVKRPHRQNAEDYTRILFSEKIDIVKGNRGYSRHTKPANNHGVTDDEPRRVNVDK